MNMLKIINLCKKAKVATLYQCGNMQWISDGRALFALPGMPIFTEATLRRAYDLPPAVNVHVSEQPPSAYNLEDVDHTENPVLPEAIQLPLGEMVSLHTQDGVSYVRSRHLDIIDDSDGQVVICERYSEEAGLYIVVKRGLMLEAVLPPVRGIIKPDVLRDLRELLNRMTGTYEREKEA